MTVTAKKQADSAPLIRGRGAVKRLRNAVQEAAPVLTLLARLESVPDRIGVYTIEAGEEVDERELVEFIRAARAQHAGRLDVVVLGPPSLSNGSSDYGPAPQS